MTLFHFSDTRVLLEFSVFMFDFLHSLLFCNSRQSSDNLKKKCSGLHKKTSKHFYFSYAFCLLAYCVGSAASMLRHFWLQSVRTVLTCRRSLLTPTSVLHHSWQFISVQDGWCSSLYCSPVSYFSPISARFERTFQKSTNNILENLFLCTAPVIRHSERITCWR